MSIILGQHCTGACYAQWYEVSVKHPDVLTAIEDVAEYLFFCLVIERRNAANEFEGADTKRPNVCRASCCELASTAQYNTHRDQYPSAVQVPDSLVYLGLDCLAPGTGHSLVYSVVPEVLPQFEMQPSNM